ncbi:MAG: IMPACT family protein [Eubacteriales bacterium]|nr:IMPACT family protein [Eubacteriales bacterium]
MTTKTFHRDMYRTVSQAARIEWIERKSRFIAECRPLADENQAQAFIRGIRDEFPDATHHVYAWILGGEQQLQRFSDDGEPQGTAGLPVLDVLRKPGIEQAGIVVARYFGGTLLGTGGLVHAYGQAAALALEAARPMTLQRCRRVLLTLDYKDLDRMRHQLNQRGFMFEAARFGVDAELPVATPAARYDELIALCNDLTAGSALIEALNWAYIPIEDRQSGP